MQKIYSAKIDTFRTSTGALISLERSQIQGQEIVVKVETCNSFTSLEDVPENILPIKDRIVLEGVINDD